MAGTETAAVPPTFRKSLRFSVVCRSFEFSLMLVLPLPRPLAADDVGGCQARFGSRKGITANSSHPCLGGAFKVRAGNDAGLFSGQQRLFACRRPYIAPRAAGPNCESSYLDSRSTRPSLARR